MVRRFLIIVAVVVSALALLCNVYVLVHFQHPDDRNQAWFPKVVVITGLTIAVLSILLLPLDVANRAACDGSIIESACRYTLPMEALWYATFTTMIIYIFAVIPWALFYYEQDSDAPQSKKVVSATMWTISMGLVLIMAMLIAYYFGGEAEFQLKSVTSGMGLLSNSALSSATACIALPALITSATDFSTSSGSLGGTACSAYGAEVGTETFAVRPTFIVYVIAVASIVSWVIFMIYAGVGVVALPMDLIKGFIYRPMKVITKSEYIRCATIIARDAQSIHAQIKAVQKEQRESGRTRKTKTELHCLQVKLNDLEDDEVELRRVFPQGEQREATWLMMVLGFYLRLFLGCLSVLLSVFWTTHIVLTVLIQPAAHPFLNSFFIWMDGVWSLFGTLSFAIFCFYLVACLIKGNTRLGVRFIFLSLYPMKIGRTSMSSLLFNTGLIMLGCLSVVQFCAQVFSVYTAETAVEGIFGGNIENFKGLGWIFKYNIFIYSFFAMICLSCLWIPFESWVKNETPKKSWETGRA